MRRCEITYWGGKAEVYLCLKGLPPIVFKYGETKITYLPFGVSISNHFVIKEINDERFKESKEEEIKRRVFTVKGRN